jgi:mono/diheme cytochrome c family protein/plastocyanin
VVRDHSPPTGGAGKGAAAPSAGAPASPPRGRGEWGARLALIAILLVLPAAVLGYRFGLRDAFSEVPVIEIVARAPEAGGFTPEAIRVPAGRPVRLRFSVPDVTHGIAIGPGLGVDLGHVDPGRVREVRLTFNRVGRYTFYCNTWCSPSHWRMRGTIEAYDPTRPDAPLPAEGPDPVIESLTARAMDIEAAREPRAAPAASPRPERGAALLEALGSRLPAEMNTLSWRRAHSPAEAWDGLRRAGLDEADAWDAVAHLWTGGIDTRRREEAAVLYARNCSPCHGETGDGKGPGADALAAQGIGGHAAGAHGLSGHGSTGKVKSPVAFAQARERMLAGTSEIYYAKLRRGGMGTGMPAFGPLFTPEETWALVDHVWALVFGTAPPLPRSATGH